MVSINEQNKSSTTTIRTRERIEFGQNEIERPEENEGEDKQK